MKRTGTLCLLIGLALAAYAPAAAAPEYEVKAAFLYNVTKFVDWPAEALRPGESFRICILGRDPFGSALDQTIAGRTTHERRIDVERHVDVSGVAGCHLVFVSASEEPVMPRLITALAGRSILTVGDTRDFVDEGGVVGLRVDGGRIRFEVNADAAARAGLRMSSQLLKLAAQVIQ